MATRRVISAEQQPDPADQATLDINETADKAEAPTTPKHSRAKRAAPAPAEAGTTETAEIETAAAAAKSGRGSRSARAAAQQTASATELPDTVSSIGHSADTATATASVVLLDAGLNVIEIAGPAVTNLSAGDTLTPLIRVSEWPSPNSERLTILSETGIGEAWVPRSGGVVVVRTPPGGGRVVVTVFGPPNAAVEPATITVRRLEAGVWPEGGAAPALSVAQPVARDRAGRDIAAEILLHIERVGDRMQPNQGWVGARGEKKRLEAFGIRPLGGILPRDLHYKGLHAGGAETPWIPGPQLCGTRGRGLPLIGFAIRVAPHLQNRFDVIYQGSFFASGVVGPNRNGEPCRPPLAGDPLEAMSIRITERTPE
jgi:hypothetical protein